MSRPIWIVCKALLFLIVLTGYTFGQCDTATCGLVVRGTITDLQIDRSDKDNVRVEVRLAMEFKNESSKPIILFKPNTDNSYFEDRYYLGGYSLTETDKGEMLHGIGRWESVFGTPFYKQLANQLDTKTPSPEFTKILQPDEVWAFPDKTEIAFSIKEDRFDKGKRKSWGEMQLLPSNLWIRVHYELSPWNVEFFKPNLLRKLAKRWKSYGNVLVEPEKDGSYNHFNISSEPMAIDFARAKEKPLDAGH